MYLEPMQYSNRTLHFDEFEYVKWIQAENGLSADFNPIQPEHPFSVKVYEKYEEITCHPGAFLPYIPSLMQILTPAPTSSKVFYQSSP